MQMVTVVTACKVACCWAPQTYDISPASVLALVLSDMCDTCLQLLGLQTQSCEVWLNFSANNSFESYLL